MNKHDRNATDQLRDKVGDVRQNLRDIGSIAQDAAKEKVSRFAGCRGPASCRVARCDESQSGRSACPGWRVLRRKPAARGRIRANLGAADSRETVAIGGDRRGRRHLARHSLDPPLVVRLSDVECACGRGISRTGFRERTYGQPERARHGDPSAGSGCRRFRKSRAARTGVGRRSDSLESARTSRGPGRGRAGVGRCASALRAAVELFIAVRRDQVKLSLRRAFFWAVAIGLVAIGGSDSGRHRVRDAGHRNCRRRGRAGGRPRLVGPIADWIRFGRGRRRCRISAGSDRAAAISAQDIGTLWKSRTITMLRPSGRHGRSRKPNSWPNKRLPPNGRSSVTLERMRRFGR